MYCYQIMRNGSVEHTSKLFASLEDAVKYFINEDAPNHYAKIKFRPHAAVSGAYVSSGEYGTEHIFVQFTEVELKPVQYNEWFYILHRKN